MLFVALFTIIQTWKQPRYPWVAKCMCECVHAYIYMLVIKNETLPFVTTGMDLEGISLNEMTWTEKDKLCMISLRCGI